MRAGFLPLGLLAVNEYARLYRDKRIVDVPTSQLGSGESIKYLSKQLDQR